jgi:hypothetical protein
MSEVLNGGVRNAKIKCTVIERFDGTVKVIGPGPLRENIEFKNLDQCFDALAMKGWYPNVMFLKEAVRNRE